LEEYGFFGADALGLEAEVAGGVDFFAVLIGLEGADLLLLEEDELDERKLPI